MIKDIMDDIISERKSKNIEDDYGIQNCWNKMIDILSKDINETVAYLENCSEEDIYFISEVFEDVSERIYPVGRLDYDTSGLLIMTNDGALANRLTHPKYEVKKTYLAKVEGVPTNADLKQLRLGVEIDGRKTAPAKSNLLDSDHKKNNALVQLTIHEGHNHQVKKMLAAVGHPVTKLKRERYGVLDLQSLQPGEYRKLKPIEISKLKGER